VLLEFGSSFRGLPLLFFMLLDFLGKLLVNFLEIILSLLGLNFSCSFLIKSSFFDFLFKYFLDFLLFFLFLPLLRALEWNGRGGCISALQTINHLLLDSLLNGLFDIIIETTVGWTLN